MIETISIIVVTVVGCTGLIGGGYAWARKKNGYVRREDCHKHVDGLTAEIKSVHRRVDETVIIISDIREKLGEVHGWVESQK
jgi:hypothetical protein